MYLQSSHEDEEIAAQHRKCVGMKCEDAEYKFLEVKLIIISIRLLHSVCESFRSVKVTFIFFYNYLNSKKYKMACL